MKNIKTSPEKVRIISNEKFVEKTLKKMMLLYPPNKNRVYVFEDFRFYTWEVKNNLGTLKMNGKTLYKKKSHETGTEALLQGITQQIKEFE